MKRRLQIEIDAGVEFCGPGCPYLMPNGWGDGPGYSCRLFDAVLTDSARRCKKCLRAERKPASERLNLPTQEKMKPARLQPRGLHEPSTAPAVTSNTRDKLVR